MPEPPRERIVLVTGLAPYLGGPATWAALRDALPEFETTIVDPLGIAGEADVARAERQILCDALDGAAAMVAHATAAKGAIEACAAADLPLLLLSPLMVLEEKPMLRAVRAAVAGPAATLLTAFAAAKLRRLRRDRGFLREQLATLVRAGALSDALLDEAGRRIADPRCDAAVARSADVLRHVLTRVDRRACDRLSRVRVLAGDGPGDRKTRARAGPFAVDAIAGAGSAGMIEAPAAVAGRLRALLAS